MVDAIIFDMDGLMIDTEKVWTAVWPGACEVFGVPFSVEIDDACRGTSGITFVRTVEDYYAAHGYPGVDGYAFMDELWSRANAEFEKGIDKMPGLDEILAWVVENKIPCAVASGSDAEQIEHHLSAIGVRDIFDVVLSGFEVENSKPAPDIFLAVAKKLGVDPAHTVVLEDSCNGIRAAAAGGFIPIMVPDYESPNEVADLYRFCCENLIEVRDLLASDAV